MLLIIAALGFGVMIMIVGAVPVAVTIVSFWLLLLLFAVTVGATLCCCSCCGTL